jgi:uncharacterized protein (TIGR02391 family)
MINSHIREQTRHELRCKPAAYYAQVEEVRKRYGKTITREEAAYVLAAKSGVDLTKRLDAAMCDRIRDIRSKEPVGSRVPSSRPPAAPAAGGGRGRRAAEPPAERERVAKQCPGKPREALDCVGLHSAVADVARKLFLDGHRARAVEEAFKLFNNAVMDKAGRPKNDKEEELDGASLMTRVFSVNNPILKLNPLRTKSHQSEQQGYMRLSEGAMTGVRNPRAHDHTLQDDPVQALHLLGFASYLMTKLDSATRVVRRRARP